MGYVQKQLASGENIVFRTTLHPIIFLWPSVAAVLLFSTVYRFRFPGQVGGLIMPPSG